MTFALEPHLAFLCVAGSHAHGTARDDSDVDLRGMCIAPREVRLSLFRSFEQWEGPITPMLADLALPRLRAHPTAGGALEGKIECVVYDIAKLVRLCAAANPNALEILFANEGDWVHETPTWRRLHACRHLFLTKKVRETFLGYAMAQLKRIETHRSWLLHPPEAKPTREAFGLPEAPTMSADDKDRIEQAIGEKLRSYGFDDLELPKSARIAMRERVAELQRDVLAAPESEVAERLRAVASHALGLPPEVVTALNAEKRYRGAMKRWESYETWKAQRNPARAELEARHGYDTKHAMHLIRLVRMGLEALEHGELFVRRPDAAELEAIRDGALPYDGLLARAAELKARMESAARTSALPDDVDLAKVDELALELMA